MVTMMFWDGSHLVFWQAALMWVGMIAFLGLVIWVIYALATSATRKPDAGHPRAGARWILDERLARGEIDAAEHQRLRELIAAEHQNGPADAKTGR